MKEAVMRAPVACLTATLAFVFSLTAAQASKPDLSRWFSNATSWSASLDGTAMKHPDFLPGTSWRTMHCGGSGVPIGNGIWQLVKYDRAHGIGLAMATTDQCSVALFKAPAPGVTVPSADLSAMKTARGIHIGSRYETVLATYGGKPVKHGSHFLSAYISGIYDTTVGNPKKSLMLPQIVTLVFDNDRVSSITISVDESGMF
jgi:hypothetical protein